jgi:ubiquinone/menaquinone biosynthesis C-methylase UbiE
MTTKSPDPTEAGVNWASDEIAEEWSRNQERRDAVIGLATEMMLDLADLRTGYRVLDVAAGTGGQTLLAARRVGANGSVLATDLSAKMLNLAADAAQRSGLTNVEMRVMDAENLDLEPNSFDAVICRTALMLFSNPPKALAGMRRAMKSRAKASALVFSTVGKNPYQGIPLAIVRRCGDTTLPQFSLSEPGVLEEAFRDGGFLDITVHPVGFRRHFSSVAEAIHNLRGAIFIRELMAKLADGERELAWTEIEQELGKLQSPDGLDLPGEMLIGVGSK